MDGAEQLMAVLGITLGLPVGQDEEETDFRPVPRSDRGNVGYRDRGMLGFYQTNGGKPFETPKDVRFYEGYGADHADLERGWKEPLITDHPAYALENYQERSSQPSHSDVYPDEADAMPDDYEFRNRNRRARGFLTRPRIPVERA
jgi:hypothetical protein